MAVYTGPFPVASPNESPPPNMSARSAAVYVASMLTSRCGSPLWQGMYYAPSSNTQHEIVVNVKCGRAQSMSTPRQAARSLAPPNVPEDVRNISCRVHSLGDSAKHARSHEIVFVLFVRHEHAAFCSAHAFHFARFVRVIGRG